MPKLTIGQFNAEQRLTPSARSPASQALTRKLQALARLSPDEIQDQLSSGALRLPRILIPGGDPDRFATNWDDVKVATPGAATDTAKDPAAAEAEIDHLVMTWK